MFYTSELVTLERVTIGQKVDPLKEICTQKQNFKLKYCALNKPLVFNISLQMRGETFILVLMCIQLIFI